MARGAVGAIRKRSANQVETYNSPEEFLESENAPKGFTPWEVTHLYKVHTHILEVLIDGLKDDPRFVEVVSQLRHEVPTEGTRVRTSPDGRQEAIATGRSRVVQDRSDTVVSLGHWFYAQF